MHLKYCLRGVHVLREALVLTCVLPASISSSPTPVPFRDSLHGVQPVWGGGGGGGGGRGEGDSSSHCKIVSCTCNV